jgi:hypothetical protein
MTSSLEQSGLRRDSTSVNNYGSSGFHTSSTNSSDVGPLQFIQGDLTDARNIIANNCKDNQKFDLILCIEVLHCITNFGAVLH